MNYFVPNYIPNLLKRIDYKLKSKPQHAPFPCPRITHGQKTQISMTDETAMLKPEEIKSCKDCKMHKSK